MEQTKLYKVCVKTPANWFGLSEEDLLGDKKTRNISWKRHLVWHVLKKEMRLSYPVMARMFNKDYTTVMYGVNHTENMLKSEKDYWFDYFVTWKEAYAGFVPVIKDEIKKAREVK